MLYRGIFSDSLRNSYSHNDNDSYSNSNSTTMTKSHATSRSYYHTVRLRTSLSPNEAYIPDGPPSLHGDEYAQTTICATDSTGRLNEISLQPARDTTTTTTKCSIEKSWKYTTLGRRRAEVKNRLPVGYFMNARHQDHRNVVPNRQVWARMKRG